MRAKAPVMARRLLTPLIAALLSLGGCGPDADGGGVTAGEAEAQSAKARQADAALNPAAQTARERRAAARSDAP